MYALCACVRACRFVAVVYTNVQPTLTARNLYTISRQNDQNAAGFLLHNVR